MNLLDDEELGRSAVVANCRVNRERGFLGSNGYDRELCLYPHDYLEGRPAPDRTVAWLDLCCGTGTALIEFPPGSGIKRFERFGESVVSVPDERGSEVPIFEEQPELMIESAEKGRYGLWLLGIEEGNES